MYGLKWQCSIFVHVVSHMKLFLMTNYMEGMKKSLKTNTCFRLLVKATPTPHASIINYTLARFGDRLGADVIS